MKRTTRKFLTLIILSALVPVLAMAQAKKIKFDPSMYKSVPGVTEMGMVIPDTTKLTREELQQIEANPIEMTKNGPKKAAKRILGSHYYITFQYSAQGEGGVTDVMLLSAKIIWKDDQNSHLILYCPYTHCSNAECATETTYSKETLMVDGGNVLLVTDGEGFGNTKDRTQVYLNHELWAQHEVGCLEAGLSVINNAKANGTLHPEFNDDWDTIIAGLSQGGGTALATLRYIEEGGLSDIYRVSFANICCGPYDPALTLNTFFHKWFRLSYPCVIPMVIKSYLLSYPDILAGYKEEDFYTDSYLKIKDEVDAALADKEHDADAINDIIFKNLACSQVLQSRVLDSNQSVYVTEILRPEIIEGTAEISKKFLECCERNNVLRGDWVPKHWVKISYCKEDAVVPYANTEELFRKVKEGNYAANCYSTGHITACGQFLTTTWASKTF